MVEKYRYFERQYLNNIITMDVDWHALTFGSMACRRSGNFDQSGAGGWLENLPWRESLYLKNQGMNNDNVTSCQIEVYFDAYTINKFQSWWVASGTVIPVPAKPYALSYNTTTNTFTVDTNGTIIFDVTGNPNENHAYLELPPFGPQDGNISDHSYLSAVMKNIINVGGNVYTFQLAAADVEIRNMLINNSTSNYYTNTSRTHGPVFYQYATTGPIAQRGIIMDTGEGYSADLTNDVCLWYRAVSSGDIGATLIVQQLG